MNQTSVRLSIVFLLASLATQMQAFAASSHSVHGHFKKDGTFVQPHRQTDPNQSKLDNWGSKGNVNPYSGKAGSVDPHAPHMSRPRKRR